MNAKDATKPDEFKVPVPQDFGLAGCRVLIAEDNYLNRYILISILTGEGMTFTEATNGRDAADTFLSMPELTFSCILMDMRMPKLDGISATLEIRNSQKADARSIPIIGVSADSFADDIQKARQAGINDYITKPIDRDELLCAMAKQIKREE